MSQKQITIALPIYQHVLATSLTLPIEMLLAGETFARRHDKHAPVLNIRLVSQDKREIASRAGIKLTADASIQDCPSPDIVIVPSLWRNPRPVLRQQQELIQWLHDLWQQGTTLIGTGTGVCFLAQSGLLDNHPATTHWHYAEQFKRDYPAVVLKPDFFITQSERIFCAASLNALADIIVHIIDQTYGRAAAQQVERNFSHEIRKPYEEQRYREGAVDRHPDELISQIQFWLKTNVSSSQTLNQVASHFGLSQRSFTRRFKTATGSSAGDYWQQLKLETAKELLSSSNLSIQEVSYQVGYPNQGDLTRLFKKHLALTPKDYRQMVRKKLFSQE